MHYLPHDHKHSHDEPPGPGSFDRRQTAPVLDLLHARHDRLYSRLFQS